MGTPDESGSTTRVVFSDDAMFGVRIVDPIRQRADVIGGDGVAVFAAQQVFEQYAMGNGQAADAFAQLLFGCGEAEDAIVGGANFQRLLRMEAVERSNLHGETGVRRVGGA